MDNEPPPGEPFNRTPPEGKSEFAQARTVKDYPSVVFLSGVVGAFVAGVTTWIFLSSFIDGRVSNALTTLQAQGKLPHGPEGSSGPIGPVGPSASDLMPVGSVISFAGTYDDKHQIPKWLPCDGRLLQVGSYRALYNSIGISYGGTQDVAFNLPDLRGRFVRGVDGTANHDQDKAARTSSNAGGATGNAVGSLQADSTKLPIIPFTTDLQGNHAHLLRKGRVGLPGGIHSDQDGDIIMGDGMKSDYVTDETGAHKHTIVGGGDTETRPVNVYMNFLIKIE